MNVTGHNVVILMDDSHNFVNFSWKGLFWIGGHQPRLMKILPEDIQYWGNWA